MRSAALTRFSLNFRFSRSSFLYSSILSFVALTALIGCNSGAEENSPPLPQYVSNPANLTAAWANDGGDKVVQSDTRASDAPESVTNSVWPGGSKVSLFGAKNEVLGFNLVLEAKNGAEGVSVSFDQLTGPGGATITSKPASGDGVYDWTARDIELFYVKYLPIRGLSKLGYETYDERHIPKRLERPYSGEGSANGSWTDRPDHDQAYPDIAVPLEAKPKFSVPAGGNQSVWVDVYVPKDAKTGTYVGSITVTENGETSYSIPVQLQVRGFTLPDVPSAKTMLNLGTSDVATRYVGNASPSSPADLAKYRLVRDRHFQMAHRHKIALIDNNEGTLSGTDRPSDEWAPRLNGSLFTAAKGYRGPGDGVGNGVFSVGTYGSWNWQSAGAAGMSSHGQAWANWFAANSPSTETFLYLIDESSNYAQTENWASDLSSAFAPARGLASMATLPLPAAETNTPDLKVVTSTMDVGDTATWDQALARLRQDPFKRFYMYNGKRPASGSFMTDDDGVALRELAWGQYKKGIDRWFYWESTYYNDYQNGRGQTNVFENAQTFGGSPHSDSVFGQTAGNYANGDGVLFYPGTDLVYPSESFGLNGPIASLRLKMWRRGIQDVDYLTMAAAVNPGATAAIVDSMVKSVLWENGVSDPSDPTWVKCDIGWSIRPDDWENARARLADIIERK